MSRAGGVAIWLAMAASAESGVPQAAIRALQLQYPAYVVSSMEHLVKADVDGDGREDWIGVASKENGDWAVLVAYHAEDGWRAGNVDMGHQTMGPKELAVLPPGRYERHGSCVGTVAVNERMAISSPLPGVLATGFGGQRRAYQLGAHAWGFVCLGQ